MLLREASIFFGDLDFPPRAPIRAAMTETVGSIAFIRFKVYCKR